MRSCIQLFSAGSHELEADRVAISAAQDREHLRDGRKVQAEHVIDEDLA
jgi:hypothetical protein